MSMSVLVVVEADAYGYLQSQSFVSLVSNGLQVGGKQLVGHFRHKPRRATDALPLLLGYRALFRASNESASNQAASNQAASPCPPRSSCKGRTPSWPGGCDEDQARR